jgi:cell division protein FtsB
MENCSKVEALERKNRELRGENRNLRDEISALKDKLFKLEIDELLREMAQTGVESLELKSLRKEA